jgi:hypothetical protein
MHVQGFGGMTEGERPLEEPGLDRNTTLKCILDKMGWHGQDLLGVG